MKFDKFLNVVLIILLIVVCIIIVKGIYVGENELEKLKPTPNKITQKTPKQITVSEQQNDDEDVRMNLINTLAIIEHMKDLIQKKDINKLKYEYKKLEKIFDDIISSGKECDNTNTINLIISVHHIIHAMEDMDTDSIVLRASELQQLIDKIKNTYGTSIEETN